MKRVMLIVSVLFWSTFISAQINLEDASSRQMMMTNLSSQPLSFTENRGQWDEKALFKANAGGATFWFCPDEVAYLFVRDTDEMIEDDVLSRPEMAGMPDEMNRPRYKKESLVIRAQFIGANPNPEVIGEDRLPHNNNYFYGNDPSKWRTDVPNYSSIIYKDIYPGIDLKYYGNGQSMKYDFIINPGADMSRIAIRYKGVDDVSITNDGDLKLSTGFGFVYENKPYVYQHVNGRKIELEATYYLIEPDLFGFNINGHDPGYALIIDPELIYSTYLGGDNYEKGLDIAVDADRNIYIVGYTQSSNYPVINPYDPVYNGGDRDAFLTKISSDGNSIVYSTFFGGIADDRCFGLKVDDSGNVYVVGHTTSTDFPTVNAFDSTLDGGTDAFVAKFASSGDSLIYSTYLGGNHFERGYDIAIDPDGYAYVGGNTFSTDFPTTSNHYQLDQPSTDGFVTKLSPDGDSLIFSTYLGGNNVDGISGITIDAARAIYVTGLTVSSDFPVINSFDSTSNGGGDAFVTKISSDGTTLGYSTYLGGSSDDQGFSIEVDISGSAYVTGYTKSINFPTNDSFGLVYNGGENDIYITKFTPNGSSLEFSAYLGGNSDDYYGGSCLALDTLGNIYITGETGSTDFPIVPPGQVDPPNDDIFITKINAVGTSISYSTLLGGTGSEGGFGIAVDNDGNAYITGMVSSADFPTVNPIDSTYNGNIDAFIAKFGPAIPDLIPTLSEWGMLIMGLLLLAAGTVAVIRKRKAVLSK